MTALTRVVAEALTAATRRRWRGRDLRDDRGRCLARRAL